MEHNWENHIVKVKKATILPNLICKICDELVDDAITIDECLHLFCRKCIYDKITEEDLDHCPICNMDLGPEPLDKLRKDRAVQSLRDTFFPPKESKVKAAEAGTSKAATNDDDISSSLDISNKLAENSGESLFPCDQESQTIDHEETRNDVMEAASDERKSFNSDVKGSQVKKSKRKEKGRKVNAEDEKIFSTNVQGHDDADLGLIKVKDIVSEVKKSKKKKKGCKANNAEDKKISTNVHGSNAEIELKKANDGGSIVEESVKEETKSREVDDEDEKIINFLVSLKGYKACPILKEPISVESSKLPQDNKAIWISLVASENQRGDAPLPQILKKYIRIKGGSPATVSHVKKYLMKRLNLESEHEVEITCLGKPVPPEMELQELAAWWFEKKSKGGVMTWVAGSSAEGFLMVLNYDRNVTNP